MSNLSTTYISCDGPKTEKVPFTIFHLLNEIKWGILLFVIGTIYLYGWAIPAINATSETVSVTDTIPTYKALAVTAGGIVMLIGLLAILPALDGYLMNDTIQVCL